MVVNANFYITPTAILNFVGWLYWWKTCSRRWLEFVCESVQYWPIYHRLADFKMESSTILNFSHVNTNGKSGSGGPFSGTVSNLVQINAIMSEQWPFNWFQNGGCRHLGLLFGNPGPEVCVNISCQSHNRITAFRDMVIWKFCKFGLKRLFPAQKFTSLVVLMPKH